MSLNAGPRGDLLPEFRQPSCVEGDDFHDISIPVTAREIIQDDYFLTLSEIGDEDLMDLDLLSTEDGRPSHRREKPCEFPVKDGPPIQSRSTYDLTITNLSYKVGQQTAISHAV